MLVAITPETHDVEIALAYATSDNPAGRPIYARAACFLHVEAETLLVRAVELARPLGYRLRIFDAYRPPAAQWVLWECSPGTGFVADPSKGSPHGRGVAIDLTLVDRESGEELDMGTGFDDFTPQAHHANCDISITAQRNRFILLGLMSAAGWDFYSQEWWHYQMFNSRSYPLIEDGAMVLRLMDN